MTGTTVSESDIWFQDDFWEFARFPEQLLIDLVSWGSSGEYSLIDCFLGDAFGVLSCQFWSNVLLCGARLQKNTLNSGPCNQWWIFFNCRCVWVWHCTTSIYGSIMYAVQDQMHPLYGALPGPCVPVQVARDALVRPCNRRTVHLCASSLQDLAVPQDFCSPGSVPLEQSWWPRIRLCGTDGLQEQGQCFFISPAPKREPLDPLLSRTVFPISCFISYVGIMEPGSSEWHGANRFIPALHG